MHTLHVDLGDRSYPIYIGEQLLGDPQWLRPHIRGQQVCIVTNETIAPLYLERVKAALTDLTVSCVILPDGEAHKTLQVLSSIYDRLLEDRHNRTTTLLALGGGVVGDMTGYAAASYQRGVDFIQIPTTLLSQVDSSVGGKTGVNHPLGKNMIGAFHQPNAVIIDTSVLQSLPARELSAGIAEVIKYGLISDEPFYRWLEEHMERLMACEPEALAYAIERSCQNKANVVAQDEREGGVRAILNLGHTFGHAIENSQGYGNWLHGEAVAAGMVMAVDLSVREGHLPAAEVERLKRLLARAKLPLCPPENMTEDEFLKLMAVDKKVLDGQLRLVLLQSVGQAVVSQDFSLSNLKQTLAAR
ncbi:3-dehydroquinate synthase [Aestuariicella hydrocarbonica]|uniref:3-dehydroquinate synthase n=1 Tax=Pseudomaricurvus hydrocarbonicus TaxID=1470433 RepID=A0A9E5MPL7_9GAMM|nr:3-dehydroquinate synthase [Aestuariicella hydrocarbonica]NHO68106.1 3-dehydroquinate synthase [Aestuariicella hydrocarbonica]